jgi:hypothetical protein
MMSSLQRFGAALFCLGAAGAALASGAVAAAPAADKPKAAAAAPRGKPGSGVVFSAVVPAKVGVGESVTLKLRFAGVTAADGATVEVRDSADQAVLATARLAQGEERTIDVPYSARTDGMQFVSVHTAQGGRTSVQSVAIRVGSGELKLKPQGQRGTAPGGEAVISLPSSKP